MSERIEAICRALKPSGKMELQDAIYVGLETVEGFVVYKYDRYFPYLLPAIEVYRE